MKALMLEALDLLRDNDPTNDIEGYHVLAQSLFFFGDETNAVGAFALINAPFEKLKASRALATSANSISVPSHTRRSSFTQNETSETAPDTPPPKSRAGSASLSRSSTIPGASLFADAEKLEEQAQSWTPEKFKACYACRTCFKKYYCDACMRKILTGGSLFFQCTSTHKFFQIYPLPDSIFDAEVMSIGGESISRTQWLAGLRRQWLDDGLLLDPSVVPKNDSLGILPS